MIPRLAPSAALGRNASRSTCSQEKISIFPLSHLRSRPVIAGRAAGLSTIVPRSFHSPVRRSRMYATAVPSKKSFSGLPMIATSPAAVIDPPKSAISPFFRVVSTWVSRHSPPSGRKTWTRPTL